MGTRARIRVGIAAALAAGCALICAAPPASALTRQDSPALPRSMAAVGDSISRGFHLNWLFALIEAPQYAWSTGSWPGSASHYRRLVGIDPQLAGHQHNDAVSGSRMADLGGQLAVAAGQRVDYVTVLVGANDVCQDSLAAMTPTSTFADQFTVALDQFFAAAPSAHVLVASIPNLYRLWTDLHGSIAARTVWAAFSICPTMLSPRATEAQRQAVLRRVEDDNDALAAVCGRYPGCRFDGYATYRYPFTAAQLSTVDYFHPNLKGQNGLAGVTWAAGFWPSG